MYQPSYTSYTQTPAYTSYFPAVSNKSSESPKLPVKAIDTSYQYKESPSIYVSSPYSGSYTTRESSPYTKPQISTPSNQYYTTSPHHSPFSSFSYQPNQANKSTAANSYQSNCSIDSADHSEQSFQMPQARINTSSSDTKLSKNTSFAATLNTGDPYQLNLPTGLQTPTKATNFTLEALISPRGSYNTLSSEPKTDFGFLHKKESAPSNPSNYYYEGSQTYRAPETTSPIRIHTNFEIQNFPKKEEPVRNFNWESKPATSPVPKLNLPLPGSSNQIQSPRQNDEALFPKKKVDSPIRAPLNLDSLGYQPSTSYQLPSGSQTTKAEISRFSYPLYSDQPWNQKPFQFPETQTPNRMTSKAIDFTSKDFTFTDSYNKDYAWKPTPSFTATKKPTLPASILGKIARINQCIEIDNFEFDKATVPNLKKDTFETKVDKVQYTGNVNGQMYNWNRGY